MRYSSTDSRKTNGVHYTPEILSDFVAREICGAITEEFRQRPIRLLDPALGDGELLYSLVKTLEKKDICNIEAVGFDTDQVAITSAHHRFSEQFPEIDLSLRNSDFLEFSSSSPQLSFLKENSPEKFDIAIANPPYVRTQIMGSKKSQEISKQFDLSGRVDLYHAFIQGISNVLQVGGVAGIIVSNKILTTKSGAGIRENIVASFEILNIWDLGDTRLFEAAVLPAVLLLRKKHQNNPYRKANFYSIYTTQESTTRRAENVIDALRAEGVVSTLDGNTYTVNKGELEYGLNPRNVWRIANAKSESWLSKVKNHTAHKFGDIGDIKVGVKTTADKVFIRSDWEKIPDNKRPELLRNLITHHVANRYRSVGYEHDRKILYPYLNNNGKREVIDLLNYPKTSIYLEGYRDVLEARSYLTESGRQWYEIWVPQNPAEWELPKIVFRDISEKPTFWMDLSKSIVNGDCYWITCKKNQPTEMLWLMLAVANSSFIEVFYDNCFHNKLYAGRRRFITQYVKEFPLPDPNTNVAREIIETSKQIYDLLPTRDVRKLDVKLNQLVWESFGFN